MRTLAVLLVLAGSAVAQEAPRFGVDVNLVNISFTVRDARGVPAADLTKDDFEVLEDGVPQNVTFFARSLDVPLQLALVADVSGSQEHFLKRHKRDLRAFLKDVLTPRDRAFLVCFGNHLRLVSDFSASADSMMEELDQFDHDGRHFLEIGPVEIRVDGTAFYDALYYATTEKLAQAQGRRAVIIFSDGEDNSSAHHMLDAIEAAQAAGAPVFAMRYTETGKHGTLTARNKYGTSVMARIARETGGEDFDAGEGDVRGMFRRIGDELRASYELAYVSANPVRDGLFRKVVIRPRDPRLRVKCKTGYVAR